MKFRSARFDGGVFKIDCPHCSGGIEITEHYLEQINTPYGADMLCPHERCNWHVGLPNAQEIADLKAGHVINTDPPTEEEVGPVPPPRQKKEITCPECRGKHPKRERECPSCGNGRTNKIKPGRKGKPDEGTKILAIIGILALAAAVAYGGLQIPRLAGCKPPEEPGGDVEPTPPEPNRFPIKQEIFLKLKHPFSDSPQ